MTHIFRTALLDGDAPEGLTEHLETCAECRLLDARLRVVDKLAPSLAGLPPDGLASRLAAPYSALGTHLAPGPESPGTDTEPLELEVAAPRPRRRTAWVAGISVAATLALIAGLVTRAPSPEHTVQIVPIQNPEGIEPMEMTLVYKQIEETFDGEGNRVGDPVVTEELAVPEGRRRVDDGVRRTTVRGGKRSVTLWKDDGIYLVEETCPYKSPILDIRFPIQPERYPEQRGGWACEGQKTTDFTTRREVLHSETVTAAGRAWKTWVVAEETVFDSAPDRPAVGQSWFAPELGDYVKVEFSVVGPDRSKRVSRTLTELRSDTTDPRLEVFDDTPTKEEIAISEGQARGHRWELLAYQSKSGECYKLKIGRGWSSSCSSVDRHPGLHVTPSWEKNPDDRSEGRSEFGSPRAPMPPSILVYGITSRETDTVQVRFADGGAPLTVPTIAHRSFQHRFFVSELPEGRDPVEAVAISADGRDLQTVTHPSQWKTTRAKRTGPVKTVGRGELQGIGWELLVYAQDDGALCTSLRGGDSGGSSCGARVPGERLIWFPGGGTGPSGSTWHMGEADLSVAKVVADMDGSPDITVTTFGGDAGFGISFYVFAVPQGSKLRAVTGFAADGTELERANNRFPARGR